MQPVLRLFLYWEADYRLDSPQSWTSLSHYVLMTGVCSCLWNVVATSAIPDPFSTQNESELFKSVFANNNYQFELRVTCCSGIPLIVFNSSKKRIMARNSVLLSPESGGTLCLYLQL